MSTHTMIKHALDQGTLMIAERPGRMIIGELIKVNGNNVVLRVIRARGLRVGERVTVAGDNVTAVRAMAVRETRAELAAWGWADADAKTIMNRSIVSDWMIIRKARVTYGSWRAAAAYATA